MQNILFPQAALQTTVNVVCEFYGVISSSKHFDILSLVCFDQLGSLGGLICVMTKEDWETEFSGAARLFALRRGIFYWEFKHGVRRKEEDGEH